MAFQTKVTIDGTDITNYVANYSVTDTVDDMTIANVFLNRSITSIISLTRDQELIISRGTVSSTDNTIFRGNISQIRMDEMANVYIEAFDKLWKLSKQIITISYDQDIDEEAGIISNIASDLITRAGLTPDVEATSSAYKINQYIIRAENYLDVLKDLASYVDYYVYYDADTNTVNFKNKGFTTFGTNLEVGQNLIQIPRWEYDYTKIANDITLTGDLQEIETTETFGSGATAYTLNFTPESVKVYVNNVLAVGGVPNISASFDYSVDKLNRQLNFTVATSGTVEARYSYLQPIKVRKKDPISIANYGTYSIHKTIETIKTTEDAELKINEILTKFNNPIVAVKGIKFFNIFGAKAGNKIRIIDSINNEDRTVNIRRYTYNYPDIIDEIDIDDEPIYEDYMIEDMFKKRIERLERKNINSGEVVNQILSLNRTFYPRRRFMRLDHNYASGTGFILSHPTFAILGTSALGTPYHNPAITTKLIQGDMTYYEDLRDTQFVSGSSDAKIITSGTVPSSAFIAFSSGSVFITSEIDVGTPLTSVKLSVGTSSGSFRYEFSNSGTAQWQTLSLNTLTSVGTSGTSTFLRITQTAASAGTILNLIDSYGQVTAPAIKFVMVD